MTVQKQIRRNDKTYNFIKEYNTYCLYEEAETKYKECFNKQDLDLIEKRVFKSKKIKYLVKK